MNKYIILDDIADEDKYLVGFENGRIGYITKEFECDSAIDLHSDWKAVISMGGTSISFPTEELGTKEVEIKTLTSLNIGFCFLGAYVPEIKCWVYVKDSYRKLNSAFNELE